MTAGEIDARVAAAEARTDTKFAQVLARIETLGAELRGDTKAVNSKLDGVVAYTAGTKSTILATAIGSVIAITALILGVLAYGGDRFGAGADISGIIDEAATRAVEQALPRQNLGVIGAHPSTPPSRQ